MKLLSIQRSSSINKAPHGFTEKIQALSEKHDRLEKAKGRTHLAGLALTHDFEKV